MPRQLSSYEKTHLARYGKSDIQIAEYGEMPVEYITNRVEFGGRVFILDHNVLIPRIETEELVKMATQALLEKLTSRSKLTIADIGCGCGAIGISLFLNLRDKQRQIKVYLADISAQAVRVAQQNIQQLVDIESQNSNILITLVSDLMSNFPQQEKFDLLVANLPYIPSARIAFLDESVKDHEPHLALDGGADGLTIIRRFLQQAIRFLKPDGIILLEIDYTHSQPEIAACLPSPASPALKLEVQIIIDSFNRQRFALISQK